MDVSRESLVAGLRARMAGWGSAWHPEWGSGAEGEERAGEERLGDYEKKHEEEAGWCRMFPKDGFSKGCLAKSGVFQGGLIEWFEARGGDGAGTAALIVAQQLYLAAQSAGGKWLVVIDHEGGFYPPGVVQYGVSLQRLIVVRVRELRDFVWVWEQALRSPATAVVWGRVEKLTSKEFRRLQLAAERGKTVGMLIRGAHQPKAPSWADLGLLVSPCLSAAPSWSYRRWKIQVIRCRRGKCGEEAILKEEGWHG